MTNAPPKPIPLGNPTTEIAVLDPTPLSPAQVMPQPVPAGSQPTTSPMRPWLWAGGAALIAWQFIASDPYKPTTVIGNEVIRWTYKMNQPAVEYQLLIAESQKIAEGLAELKAAKADHIGKCNLTTLLGREAYDLCMGLVRTYYIPSISEAEGNLQRIRQKMRTLK